MIDALELAGAFVLGFLIAAALCATILKVLIDLHRSDRDLLHRDAEHWRNQERELLNRIQHPERMPVAAAREVATPGAIEERLAKIREMNSVGRVVGGEMELP
jgi:hypothetical protein